jgi:hypothetical protein
LSFLMLILVSLQLSRPSMVSASLQGAIVGAPDHPP